MPGQIALAFLTPKNPSLMIYYYLTSTTDFRTFLKTEYDPEKIEQAIIEHLRKYPGGRVELSRDWRSKYLEQKYVGKEKLDFYEVNPNTGEPSKVLGGGDSEKTYIPLAMQEGKEIEITDEDLEAAKTFATHVTREGPAVIQILMDGQIRVEHASNRLIGSALTVILQTWDPAEQSEQERLDEIADQLEKERMEADQLVEIV